jgi:hypothetical protein
MFKTADGQIIQAGKSWTDANGITHPSNWQIWTAEYKESMGLTEFTPEPQPDDRFYTWTQNEDLTYNKTEKSLDSLKTIWIAETKNRARALLFESDWQVVAKAERDRDIDEAVATYRAAVISACTTIEGQINACDNLGEFKLLFDTPRDSDGNATGNSPIHDWPSSD